MAVDLEELALKSIEQYATLNVQMKSLEISIADMNRRSEVTQDRFSSACDKLARIEEKVSSWVDDRTIIHKRIDDTRTEVDKLIVIVRDITDNVKDHSEDHCGGCSNTTRMDVLEQSLKALEVTSKDSLKHQAATDTTLEMIVNALKPFTYKIPGVPFIKEFPIWVLLVLMIVFGFGVDVYTHQPWFQGLFGGSR